MNFYVTCHPLFFEHRQRQLPQLVCLHVSMRFLRLLSGWFVMLHAHMPS